MSTREVISGDNWQIWYDPESLPAVQPQHFEPAFWQRRGAVTGTAGGRRLAYFIQTSEEMTGSRRDMVLRHYYRGGLIAKLNKDRFWRCQVSASRAMQEFTLLQWMYEQALPVPRPVAALYKRNWWSCQSDILIERLPCDGDLFTTLLDQPLTTEQWQHLGQVIAGFHNLGVYHSDLNCHNILIRQKAHGTTFWLIDFDKCERRSRGTWQQANLQRLLRSLEKEKGLHQSFFFDTCHWQSLMDGYHEYCD